MAFLFVALNFEHSDLQYNSTMTTTPIRIGFMGLSVSNGKPTGWASTAHWPYLSQTSKFAISALCNSSVSSAETAKAHYQLPAETKCYDDPAKLAADADVDLVVCSVRVDKHYTLIKSALEAGKNVYCEWPLGANVQEAEELAAIARKTGVKTMVGLQARQSPLIGKMKDILASGKIGRVLSSTVVTAASNGGPTESEAIEYFKDRKVGGNVMTIHFGHTIDWVVSVLGELESLTGLVSIQRPQIDILRDGKKVKTVTKDTPDQIMLQGQLKSGGTIPF